MAKMKITVDTKGIEELMRREPGKVAAWLDGVAETMVGDIKASFGTGPAGRSYKRGQKSHVASQAGNPPNTDLGTLINSIRWERESQFKRVMMDGVEYGILLEDGTERMGARPFFGPVFKDWGGAKIEADAKKNLKLES